MKQLVCGIVVHGAVGDKVFKLDVRIKLPDFRECEDGKYTAMPGSLSNPQVDREVIRAVGSSGGKEGAAIEVTLTVPVPAPSGIGIGK